MTPNQRAIAFGLASVACWSTAATAFKLALAEVDSYQLVALSSLTAAVVLLGVVIVKGQLSELVTAVRAHWRITLVAGLMNPVVYYLILFKAYELLPAQVAQPINYTWSIVLTLMAIVILKQQIRAWDLIAAAVCYGGVFLIATQGNVTSFGSADPLGLALALGSTVIWASYWILNIRDQREPTIGLCLNFLVAVPAAFGVCYVMSDFSISAWGMLTSAYVGLIEMAVGFLFWSTALRLTTNAASVSNLIFLSPFISLVIINRVLGEEIYTTTIVGLILIVAGLLYQQYMNNRQNLKTQPAPQDTD